MRTIDRFTAHCNLPNAGFGCFDYFDRTETVNFFARTTNLLQEGAYPEYLKKLSRWIEDPGDRIREFFTHVDGAFLYVDPSSGCRPFEICSLCDWHVSTHAMRKWYLTKDAEFFGDIDFLTNGHAIGRISQTPDYISIVASGNNAGKIYHVAHDDFRYEPFAESFDEFIERMIADPAKFLDDIGAFAHYRDGETETTWVPKTFHETLPASR